MPETATDNHEPIAGPATPPPDAAAVLADDVPMPAPPPLASRIDPADILADPDVDIFPDDDEDDAKGKGARWGSPPKSGHVRVHPAWVGKLYVLDFRKEGDRDREYILTKPLAKVVMDEELPLTFMEVYLVVDRDGLLTFWPLRLGDPTEMGEDRDDILLARKAIARGRVEWTKIYWRRRKTSTGWRARGLRKGMIVEDQPAFPDDPTALLMKVIGDRLISDRQDPRFRKFLGED
jgi:hypothetical protein